MGYVVIDFETRSEVKIKTQGGYVYAEHPSTRSMCIAWRYTAQQDRQALKYMKTQVAWTLDGTFPKDLAKLLLKPSVKIVAHNANFERLILKHVHKCDIPINRFFCTAAQARRLALPGNLEGAAIAAKLAIKKDIAGNKFTLKYACPTRKGQFLEVTPEAKQRIMDYCATDIDAEVLLFCSLPLTTGPDSLRIYEVDQKINDRGFRVDVDQCRAAIELSDVAAANDTDRLIRLTDGVISTPTQGERIKKWCAERGVELADLTAKTVNDTLLSGQAIPDDVRDMLEIRQGGAKASIKKYNAALDRVSRDGRIRGAFNYHRASTGRWGGTGFQPHNMPRGIVKHPEIYVELIKMQSTDMIDLIGYPLSSVLSSCVRSAIIPSDGHDFICADYASIETCGLFWLADHKVGLEMIRNKVNLYMDLASSIYGKPITTKECFEYQVGKKGILGLGYQMGDKKFTGACEQDGIILPPGMAWQTVNTYRRKHAPIPALWEKVENAAIDAVRFPGKAYTAGKTKWYVDRGFLVAELPSRRCIVYAEPRIDFETYKGRPSPKLKFMAEQAQTRQWVEESTYGGKLVENITQAVCCDLLASALLRLESHPLYRVVAHTHDEALAEVPIGKGSVEEFIKIMCDAPAWAEGLPIRAEGWRGPRYRK